MSDLPLVPVRLWIERICAQSFMHEPDLLEQFDDVIAFAIRGETRMDRAVLESHVDMLLRIWTMPTSVDPGEPPSRTWPAWSDGTDPEAWLARLVRAARCRLAVGASRGVYQDDLAALAGCARSTVRVGVAKGELQPVAYSGKRRKGSPPVLIDPKSASAWLAARDTPGFETAATAA